MPDQFSYPLTYSSFWMDNYYMVTWAGGMLFLAVVWAVFFRYGKFTYGVDLGCFTKTILLVLLTTVSLGFPQYYNTRFAGEHGQDGTTVQIDGSTLRMIDRNGVKKEIPLQQIKVVSQEEITYNPPPKIHIVAEHGSIRDSVFITTNLPDYKRFLSTLSSRTGIEAKLR